MNKESKTSPKIQARKAQNDPPLDRYGNNTAQKLKKAFECSKSLFMLRKDIGKFYKRVRPCGCWVTNNESSVSVAKGESGRAFYSGLQTCKSVWACPVCSLKISSRRAFEVRSMLSEAINKQELNACFLSLTIPHGSHHNLKKLQKAVSDTFNKITAHGAYKGVKRKKKVKVQADLFTPEHTVSVPYFDQGLKQKHKIEGFVRALEVKKGRNGWHPHLHVCFVASGSKAETLWFGSRFIALWMKQVEKYWGEKPARQGQDARLVYNDEGIADYITKWDLSKELTEGMKKEGKGGLTPFQIFKEFQNTGDEAHLNDFLHYCHSFKGVKQLTFSADFKKKFLVNTEEMSEEDICKDEKITFIILSMEKGIFQQLYKKDKESEFLEIIEQGEQKIQAFLHEHIDQLVQVFDYGGAPHYKILF